MTWHARRAVDLYLERFPDLRYDEDEILRSPRELEESGAPSLFIDGPADS